ncbi:MAG: nitronate monooxygenase [Candidatus Riflebacteria bacterium]|nr:nitronate monooxygenase [Candidatus Riflebacteria bacterium]
MKILPRLVIGSLQPRYPIIQGGMAVKVSTGRLAGSVAREGGIGLIAGSGMTDEELRTEIRVARSIADGGIVGVNTLVAASRFIGVMKTAVDEGIDLLVAGAGFSRDLLALGRSAGVPVVPIVSSAKLAIMAESLGASAVIVEGREAGGHIGTTKSSRVLFPLVKEAVKIPVIIAGGIADRADLMEVLKFNIDGVQVGTRFAASVECNAALAFKQRYLQAKEGDVIKIHSPVGLPGNALMTPFYQRVSRGEVGVDHCDGCLKRCSHSFCIVEALLQAKEGNLDKGLVFAGEHVYKIKEILTVKEIFHLFFDGLEPRDETHA